VARTTSQLVILDVDGTLVDTNYQHVLAWARAFREHGHTLPLWQIHRAMGMGGDKLVEHLAGKAVESNEGDTIRDSEQDRYQELIGEVVPFAGACELLAELRRAGLRVVLASSAKEAEIERYVELLAAGPVVDGWTSSAEVESTKPAPDLVHAAFDKGGGGPAVMIGDTTWDVLAA